MKENRDDTARAREKRATAGRASRRVARDAGRRRSISRSCPVPNYRARYFQSVAAAFRHDGFVTRETRNGAAEDTVLPLCRVRCGLSEREREISARPPERNYVENRRGVL